MKFSLFQFRPHAVLALLGSCMVGIVSAADPLPSKSIVEDLKSTGSAAPSGAAIARTNQMPLSEQPVVWKGKFPTKPNEINVNDWMNSRPKRLPAPVRNQGGPDRKDEGLLDDESSWAYVTPQDIIDDYMARHILKIPDYTKNRKATAIERFYENLSRGAGTTNALSTLALFGLQDRNKKTKGQDGSNEDEDSPQTFDSQRDALGNTSSAEPTRGLLSTRPNGYSAVSPANSDSELTAETMRQGLEQKEHLDAFRKIWNFEPPAATKFDGPTPALDWRNPAAAAMARPTPEVDRPNAFTLPGLSPNTLPGTLPGLSGTTYKSPTVPGLPTFSAMPGYSPSSAPDPTPTSTSSQSPSRAAIRAKLNQPPTFAVPQRPF